MKYPEEFVEAVKAAYPHQPDLHEALGRNQIKLGMWLGKKVGMDPERVVMFLEEGQADQLLEEARFFVNREKLYGRWLELIS